MCTLYLQTSPYVTSERDELFHYEFGIMKNLAIDVGLIFDATIERRYSQYDNTRSHTL